jgi:hypothetical protein
MKGKKSFQIEKSKTQKVLNGFFFERKNFRNFLLFLKSSKLYFGFKVCSKFFKKVEPSLEIFSFFSSTENF